MASQSILRCASMFRSTSLLSKWSNHAAALTIPGVNNAGLSARFMSSVQEQFAAAREKLNTLKEDPGSDVKLKMYALFKQVTSGKVSTPRPGMIDFVGRAKWDAWNSLGDMSQEEAQKAYINLIDELVAAEKSDESAASQGSDSKYTFLDVKCVDGLRTITLNRPKKYNALTNETYLEWVAALKEASEDKKTSVVAMTGAGSFFCAGNDLSNFTRIPESGPEAYAGEMAELLYKFVDAFIDFPKPLIGVINGPAFGVSVTTLALYDAVYSTDKAWFQTPFTNLGQSAEGCSSFTFPRMMGPGLATEMLIFNKKITAEEAKEAGLITEVFPDATFQETVWPKIQAYAKLPPQSLVYGKALYRNPLKEALKKANRDECDRLQERWLSDECKKAVMAFLSRK